MATTLTLADARTELIHIAGIDGKTGSDGRHSPTRLNAILNRKYRELLSRVGQLGMPQGLANGGILTLGSALTNEDFISVDVPTGVSEVIGVDVRSTTWQKLDPIAWEQRRDICNPSGCVTCGGLLPKHGVGFWTMRQAPSVSAATLTGGKLAIWPTSLAGKSYQIHYVQTWTDITNDAHVFLLYEGWDEWLLNAAAMACASRDGNKRTNYDTARDAWLSADALIVSQAARLQRSGTFSPTPYGGRNL